MSSRNALEIKGVRNGLVVRVHPEDEWNDFVRSLITHIDRQREFFKGASLALELGERTLRRQELGTLQHMLADRDVKLWAVLSKSVTTLNTARKLELQTTLDAPAPEPPAGAGETGVADTLLRVGEEEQAASISPEEVGTSGVLVKRTLRSGRTIRSDGHVVVIGDVNPGAEIVAGGDVIIWGRLRGMVHAGALGDEEATVCALDMTPVQLRIAGHIATSPKDQKRVPRPEIAMVRDNRIVVEAWH
ncbi:MAG: septum site-determining protein MinC [Anaerolineae bacterium]|nr:septum site-determining protein MinC [Anaerolineae bacterium]